VARDRLGIGKCGFCGKIVQGFNYSLAYGLALSRHRFLLSPGWLAMGDKYPPGALRRVYLCYFVCGRNCITQWQVGRAGARAISLGFATKVS